VKRLSLLTYSYSLTMLGEAELIFDTAGRRRVMLFYNLGVKKSARGSVTFETVRRAALALPDVEEGTAWRVPAFRRDGQMFLCFRKDLDSIVVRASFEQRDEMIQESPETYYTTDHHRNYPWVLARVEKLDPDVVPDLLRLGWQSVPGKKRRPGAR
jgi:hypothetical protein